MTQPGQLEQTARGIRVGGGRMGPISRRKEEPDRTPRAALAPPHPPPPPEVVVARRAQVEDARRCLDLMAELDAVAERMRERSSASLGEKAPPPVPPLTPPHVPGLVTRQKYAAAVDYHEVHHVIPFERGGAS